MGQAIFSGRVPPASLGQPGVFRAVLLAGVYLAMICLISMGLGTIMRHTAGAITAVVALLLVVPGIISALPKSSRTRRDVPPRTDRWLVDGSGGPGAARAVAVGRMGAQLYAAVALASRLALVRRDV